MNETLEMLGRRRSVPLAALAGPGPSEAELATLLTLASRVPDHGKLAPWRFLVLEGEGRARAGAVLAQAWRAQRPAADEAAVEFEARRFLRAPLVLGVVSRAAPHPKIPEWEQTLSAGAVCMSALVAARALGFGATWLTEWYAYDEAVGRGLGLAPGERFAGFVYVGRPTVAPEDRPRPALADIVTRF